jgi:carbamoyl-phosphate synthase large subunit
VVFGANEEIEDCRLQIAEWGKRYSILDIRDSNIEYSNTRDSNDELSNILRTAKQMGFADSHLARLLSNNEYRITNIELRKLRQSLNILPTFLRVDTCAAEFEAHTPYMYSSYESEDEAQPTDKQKILILGGGPNRIGQGIEFDYCCCQAAFALKDLGFETIMLNCNPETVSTDYDTADRLYFEPLTFEHVLNVVEREQVAGVIVQFGGQTPLNLAESLRAAGVPIIGTSPESIALAEDREKFAALLRELEIEQPENGIAFNLKEARAVATRIGYPVLVRPSFVLGGRAMAIVGDESQLEAIVLDAMQAAEGQAILIDRFMEDAYEVDVDALCDGENVIIGAVMQHIEEAGVHSGDSACVLPPYKVSMYYLGIMRDYVTQLGKALNVRGLMNVQFALKDDVVYVLEVNPRASRTVPYASKATGLPLARVAAQVMAGQTLDGFGRHGRATRRRFLRQGGGAALQQTARRRCPARSRNALHRRGDGARFALWARLRQKPASRRDSPAAGRHGAGLGQRLRQRRGAQDCARPVPHGIHRFTPPPARQIFSTRPGFLPRQSTRCTKARRTRWT